METITDTYGTGSLDDVPCMRVSGAITSRPVDFGLGHYVISVTGCKLSDYRKYIEVLEIAGFAKEKDKMTDNELVALSVFRKGMLCVWVTYIAPQNRTFVGAHFEKVSKWNPEIVFEQVPLDIFTQEQRSEARDCGAGNYIMVVSDVDEGQFAQYLKMLEKAEYVKQADNGEGLYGAVYSYIYKKDRLVLTVTYVKQSEKIYLSTGMDLPISEHLHYNPQYIAENQSGSKTKLYMIKSPRGYTGYVIQLKNGHFIIHDGDFECVEGNLITFLEGLVPHGEKPIVEAWFISHGNDSCCGALCEIATKFKYAERICVEGIYYNEPSDDVVALFPTSWYRVKYIRKTAEWFNAKVYRPQIGQRYYFNDLYIDVLMTHEQLPVERTCGEFNDSTTWLVYNIDGQKCLLSGEGNRGGMRFIRDTYSQEYMEYDIFTVPARGWNTRRSFTDYCKVKTALFGEEKVPEREIKANNYLKERVEEWISWEGRTRILEFPYEIGQCK